MLARLVSIPSQADPKEFADQLSPRSNVAYWRLADMPAD